MFAGLPERRLGSANPEPLVKSRRRCLPKANLEATVIVCKTQFEFEFDYVLLCSFFS